MASPLLVYAHPRDNMLLTADTITVTVGATETGYGTDKLFNSAWADPCKSTGVNLSVVFEFASPVLPVLATILNSNLDVAAKLQGHTSDSWGTPDVDLTFGIPTMNARGIFSSPHIDVATLDPSATAKAFWRLHIASNSRNVVVGEFYMGPRRTLDGYVFPGVGFQWQGASVLHRSYMGVGLGYEQHPGVKAAAGTLIVSGADITKVTDLIGAARFRARPFVLVPRSDVDDAWLVRFSSDQIGQTPVSAADDEFGLPIEQESRGLPWVDPDA